MSRPRGNGTQRRLAAAAKAILEPHGFRVAIDFSLRSGHQKLLILLDGDEVRRLELVSTPRCEDRAIRRLERQCRDFLKGRGP